MQWNPNALLFWGLAASAGWLIYGDAWHAVMFGTCAGALSLTTSLLRRR